MDEQIKSYFSKKMNIDTLTRNDLIKALIKRHTDELKPLRAEHRELNKKKGTVEAQMEKARESRDKINDEVMDLKQRRQMQHELANDKRRQFFVLMEKLDDMEKLDAEINDYSTSLDRMEWEIQTTKITASDEKSMIKRMKELYQKMTEVNQEAQKKLGIKENVASLSKGIGENLAEAQNQHEGLLKKADESDEFHDTFLEVRGKLSEIRIHLRRIERKIHNHKESYEYWKDWVGGKHA